MAGIIIPGRAARLVRPVGPFQINKDSPQAQHLGLWAVPQFTGYLDVLRNVEGGVVGTTNRFEAKPLMGTVFRSGTANEYGTLTNQALVNVNPCTMTCWFNMTSAVPLAPMIQCDTSRSQGLSVNRGSTNNQLTYAWDNVAGEYDWDSGLTIPTSVWALAAMTISSSAANVYLFSPSGVVSASRTGSANAKTLTDWYVGNDFDVLASRAFDGWIGEWRVYANRVMTPNELWELYDPATRWDLYWTPGRRVFFDISSGALTITADPGAYTVTGTAATLKKGSVVTADPGSYALSGTAADLEKGSLLTAVPGSYAISGTAATLSKTINLTADPGAYAISGTTAALTAARELNADSGAYAINGTDATLIKSTVTIVADGGSYAISGTAASLLAARQLACAAGSYAISGTSATLTYSNAGLGFVFNVKAALTFDIVAEGPQRV